MAEATLDAMRPAASPLQTQIAKSKFADLRTASPGEADLALALAMIEGIAAARAATASDRDGHLTAGGNSLMAAIRRDRTVLDLMHLAPELVAIRQAPDFARALRALLDRP
jgi:hypothetical protein